MFPKQAEGENLWEITYGKQASRGDSPPSHCKGCTILLLLVYKEQNSPGSFCTIHVHSPGGNLSEHEALGKVGAPFHVHCSMIQREEEGAEVAQGHGIPQNVTGDGNFFVGLRPLAFECLKAEVLGSHLHTMMKKIDNSGSTWEKIAQHVHPRIWEICPALAAQELGYDFSWLPACMPLSLLATLPCVGVDFKYLLEAGKWGNGKAPAMSINGSQLEPEVTSAGPQTGSAEVSKSSEDPNKATSCAEVSSSVMEKLEGVGVAKLRKMFDRDINDVADFLGVGLNMLKKHCRRLGIMRWPYRKINSLNELIEVFKEMKDRDDVREQILASLEAEKMRISLDPMAPLGSHFKALQQAYFKADKRRKLEHSEGAYVVESTTTSLD